MCPKAAGASLVDSSVTRSSEFRDAADAILALTDEIVLHAVS